MRYLEVHVEAGAGNRVAISANNISLAKNNGFRAFLFGAQYPLAADYFSALLNEGWKIVDSQSNSFVAIINGLPFANNSAVYNFIGDGRFEVEWLPNNNWCLKGAPRVLPPNRVIPQTKPSKNTQNIPYPDKPYVRMSYFAKGRVVACYSNEGYEGKLTVGNNYEVLDVIEDIELEDNLLKILNDQGSAEYIPSFRFVENHRAKNEGPKYLVGDNVKYIDDFFSEDYDLTLEKTYKVIQVRLALIAEEDLIVILDDNNKPCRIGVSFFSLVSRS